MIFGMCRSTIVHCNVEGRKERKRHLNERELSYLRIFCQWGKRNKMVEERNKNNKTKFLGKISPRMTIYFVLLRCKMMRL